MSKRTCRTVDDGKDFEYMDLVLGFDGIVTLLEWSEKIAVAGIRDRGGRIRTEALKRCWNMQKN